MVAAKRELTVLFALCACHVALTTHLNETCQESEHFTFDVAKAAGPRTYLW